MCLNGTGGEQRGFVPENAHEGVESKNEVRQTLGLCVPPNSGAKKSLAIDESQTFRTNRRFDGFFMVNDLEDVPSSSCNSAILASRAYRDTVLVVFEFEIPTSGPVAIRTITLEDR